MKAITRPGHASLSGGTYEYSLEKFIGSLPACRCRFHGDAQTDPYKTPLYWSTYEYNIVRQHINVCYNYIPETEFLANINWVDANLKNLGYNMIEVDGWGDSMVLNENGYRVSTPDSGSTICLLVRLSAIARDAIGMYADPLWIHVDPSDTHTKIVGTDINVSSLIDNPSDLQLLPRRPPGPRPR